MPKNTYLKAICKPELVLSFTEYYDNVFPIARKLMTDENIRMAGLLTEHYMTEANFLFRDANGKLLLFRTTPKEAILAGSRGLALADKDIFPELQPGEYVGLGSFLTCVDIEKSKNGPHVILPDSAADLPCIATPKDKARILKLLAEVESLTGKYAYRHGCRENTRTLPMNRLKTHVQDAIGWAKQLPTD